MKLIAMMQRCCYAVAKVFLSSFWHVTMWLLGCCCAVAKVFCMFFYAVALEFLLVFLALIPSGGLRVCLVSKRLLCSC